MTAPAIKICGLTTPETLDAALRAEATHVGLVFFPKSPRNVDLDLASDLATLARDRAKVVGLFVNPDNRFIDKVRSKVTLQAIQLHGGETPAQASQIRQRNGIEVWKAIPVSSVEDLHQGRKFLGSVDRILFDAKAPSGSDVPGGSGLRFDWNLLRGFRHSLPWVLAGGLDARNVGEAMRVTGANFVDVSSGVESTPGVKDATKIAAFCAAARLA